MFVQISNSRLRKKKSSPRGSDASDNDDNMKEEEERSPGKNDQQFTEVDLEHGRGPADEVVVKGGREHIFGRIGEKAKGLKGGLGRLFGEREPSDVRVYTIDREMKGTELADRRRATAESPQFASSELSEHREIGQQRGYHHPDPVHQASYVHQDTTKQRGFGEPGIRTRIPASVELSDRLQKTRQPTYYDVGATMKPVAIQATPYPPLRLHFLPPPTWNDTDDKIERFCRLMLNQAALLIFLILWIMFGALLFYFVEGSFETEEIGFLLESQGSNRISLSTDLVHFISESEDQLTDITGNSTWDELILEYFDKEDHIIKDFHKMGYSFDGELWNFSGSLLVCVAIITTLGYGFPLPTSAGGIVCGIIYAAIGLPLNYYLLKNSGRSLGAILQVQAKDVDLRLQTLKTRIQNLRKFGESREEGAQWPEGVFEGEFRPPVWLPAAVPAALLLHYFFGVVVFGVSRGDTAYSILMFPCDLSANFGSAGAATRLSFAVYLELTALLVSTSIALCKVPSPTSLLVDPLIRMNILTNTLD